MAESLTQLLISAAAAGNLEKAEECLRNGADWRAGGEEALYQALCAGHLKVAHALLMENTSALLPTILGTSDFWNAQQFAVRQNLIIEGALQSMEPETLLSMSVELHSRGLFRFLAEKSPDTVRESGLVCCVMTRSTAFLREILDLGARPLPLIDFGWLIAAGDVETVRMLAAYGAPVNDMIEDLDDGIDHPLILTQYIADSALRARMIDALMEAGADIRVERCQPLRQMVYNGHPDAFSIFERLEPGSEKMAVLACSQDGDFGLRRKAMALFPFLTKWMTNSGLYSMTAYNAADAIAWAQKLTPEVLAEDDGFILKLAAVSRHAAALLPAMIEAGGNPNTARDTPLEITAMFGADAAVAALLAHGADPYANEAACLRFMPVDRIGEKTAAALHAGIAAAAPLMEEASRMEYAESAACEELRLPSTTAGGRDSGLLLLAKAGLLRRARDEGRTRGITAADLMQKNAHGTSIVSVLAARREFELLFSPEFWGGGDLGGLQQVWSMLTPGEQKDAADFCANIVDIHRAAYKQEKLRELARRHPVTIRRP